MDRKTITKQRDHHLTNSKVRQLQQRWQELKERELRAQQHNKELLQQFEKAQDSVKEMLACTAAMKIIRMEHEQYLKESSPHWQQQHKAAQRMRMEDNLRSCLKKKEAEETKVYAGSDKKTQHIAETQDKDSYNIFSDYNQDSSPHQSYLQASWFPLRVCPQPQGSSQIPPSFLSHHHPFMLQHVSSTPSHHLWPKENVPGWSSLQTDRPWSAGASGLPDALWGPLYSKDPPSELMASQTVAKGPETSGASGSKSEICGGKRTNHLSQELDVKPVRLSSNHAESSESEKDSRTVRECKKQKRGRSHCTSSEKESHSSEESSRTSSAVIIPSAAVVRTSESDASSGKCKSKKRRQRSGAQVAESLRTEKDKNSNGGDESAGQRVSGRQTEESTAENSSADDDKSDVCREESGRNSIQLKCKAGDEKQKQEIISSEQSSSEEKDDENDHEKDPGDENRPQGDVEDEDDDDPKEKDRCKKEEAKDDDRDKRSSASSQDEDDESEQDETEEDEERPDEEEQGESGEEQRSDKEGDEESHSEDSVISSEENRKHITPEEADDDDDNKTGFSDGDDSNDLSEEDDIENLLAPQEQIQKREGKDLKPAEKPKVSDTKVVQVESDRSTKITPQHSDSDEFDHFYD